MKLNIGIVSLGCSKNRVDSETMMGLLTGAGYVLVSDPNDADVLIVNTCGFIEPAKQESIDTILDLARYKEGKCRLLVMTGCLSQRYADELAPELPEVDIFLGVGQYENLTDAIEKALSGEEKPKEAVKLCGRTNGFIESERVLTTPSYSAYVRISDGCDNRCAYCAIPLIRGGYRSRPMEDILRETSNLASRGVKELSLVAQDTTRYGLDFGKHSLAELIRRVCETDGIEWVRALYYYPDSVTNELLETMANEKKVCEYLDLPIQHINADLLRSMNRRGSPERIRELFKTARDMGFTLRTTVIVGYPGETKERFEELLDFVREIRFDRLGAFAYSPEDDTAAAVMPLQIDDDTKAERLDIIMMAQQAISLERNKLRVNEVCEVLVEGCDSDKKRPYFGRSRKEAPEIDGSIRFSGPDGLKPGEIIRVRITGADIYDLKGECMV